MEYQDKGHNGTGVIVNKDPRPIARFRAMIDYGGPICLGLNGEFLDQFVTRQIMKVLQPVSLELSLAAEANLEQERIRLDQQLRQRLERAAYEADSLPVNTPPSILAIGWWHVNWNVAGRSRFASNSVSKTTTIGSNASRQCAYAKPNAHRSDNSRAMFPRCGLMRQQLRHNAKRLSVVFLMA